MLARKRHPFEVAESSLDDDRDLKLPRYAEAGVLESWIIDLPGQRLWVHRQPMGRNYQSIQEHHHSGDIALQAFPWVFLDLKVFLDLG